MEKQTNKFLTARWEYLVMANYEVNPEILLPYLPKGTEIDFWNGKTYLSLVGFMFLDTRVLGIPIPFHLNFEEVNLRFYVRYKDYFTKEWKRGVVFVKEIVPKIAIAKIAKWVYNENYVALPTRHEIKEEGNLLKVSYQWKYQKQWNFIKVEANPIAKEIHPDSEEEFITEHYWGYTRLNENKTLQYQVEHPKWQVFEVQNYEIQCDFGNLYGNDFVPYLQKPSSILLANGSEISVRMGGKIKQTV